MIVDRRRCGIAVDQQLKNLNCRARDELFNFFESRKCILGGECRALSFQLCSAEQPPAHLSSGSFRGSLLKSISARERRYSQRVSLQMAFMDFLWWLYA